jgi:hypothetical protein
MPRKIMFPGVVGVRQAPARPVREGGVRAEFARAGERMASGARVTSKRTGVIDGGLAVVVGFSDGTEQTLRADRMVQGSRPRTDMLAGPVSAGRCGDRPSRIGRGDGETPGDRHSRLIDAITYDTAATLRHTR